MLRRAGPFALCALAGCFGPTEITIELTTNAACSGVRGGGTLVYVSSSDHQSESAVATTNDCRDGSGLQTIGSLVLLPSGDKNATVALEIVTSLGRPAQECTTGHFDGCIVARRKVSFRRHANVQLPIEMRAECEGVVCAESQTCVLGTCRTSDTTAPGFCDETTCDGGAPSDGGDASDAGDAGASDAQSEAGVDASVPPCPGAEGGPVLLTGGGGAAAYNLLATPTDLFWADPVGGNVWSVPKAGGAALRWATGENAARAVARDSTLLYWTALSGLRATPSAGATATTLATQTIENGGGPMVADPSGGVYWFDTDTNQIVFTKVVGGSAMSRVLTRGPAISAFAMAFDGTDVYWTSRGANPGLFRIASTAAADRDATLFAGAANPVGITVDATDVLWTTGDGGVLAKRKDLSGPPVAVATGQAAPYDLALQGPYVYFTNAGNSPMFAGTVARVARTGGKVTTLASGRAPAGIAVDAQCVYWLYRDAGEVWKASR